MRTSLAYRMQARPAEGPRIRIAVVIALGGLRLVGPLAAGALAGSNACVSIRGSTKVSK